MYLNVKKCYVISFTLKKNKTVNHYAIDGEELQRTTSVRDLGITFDEQLSFRQHFDSIVKKSNKLLGFITRQTKHFKKQQV